MLANEALPTQKVTKKALGLRRAGGFAKVLVSLNNFGTFALTALEKDLRLPRTRVKLVCKPICNGFEALQIAFRGLQAIGQKN